MMLIRVLWNKCLEEAKKVADTELAQFVFGLERALQEHGEQPLEVALRLLTFTGPDIRVSVEDLGKLIHSFNNLSTIKQELEHQAETLGAQVILLEMKDPVSTVTCPRCKGAVLLRSKILTGK